MHALERYRKHRDLLLLYLISPFIGVDAGCGNAELVLHMRVEDTRLDKATSLYLHEQAVVAGLRKTIGE